MKKILLGGMLCLMACMSCTEQPAKEDFVTDCEKSDFVKTPRFAETMAWFEKLADYSSMFFFSTIMSRRKIMLASLPSGSPAWIHDSIRIITRPF